jgi:hypothetical protein
MIKCPYCAASYYYEKYRACTATYYPPIYKNGVNINPDRNYTSVFCHCINCNKDFSYKIQGGKIIEEM